MMNRRQSTPLAVLIGLAVLLVPALAFAGGDGDFADYEAKGLVWMYLAAFGVGFLTSLTPCVYPMIPIVLGVFGARDEDVTRRKAFGLATMYVLGMGLLFATLGLIFALIGKKSGFGSLLSNPYVVIPLVGLYALLAASMFGAFEMNLPQSVQNRLNRVGGRGYAGAFGLGMVGGLTAAPCTGPFLAGMIAAVAAEGNPLLGFTLLFTYALGIGVLFWVIGVFAVSMPKSGRWMETVKSVGGIALLVAGFYFLQPLLPMKAISSALSASTSTFLLIAGGVALFGLLIGAVHLSFHDRPVIKARKAAGVALTVVGLSGVVVFFLTPDRYLPWVYDEQAAFAQAKAEDKGVMIDFAADWCTPCKQLEVTFSAPDVYETIVDNYVPLKFDVTAANEVDEARQEKYGAANLPAVIFLDANGVEYGRISKEMSPSDFLEVLEPATEKMKAGKPAKAEQPPGTKKSEHPMGWERDEKAAFERARREGKGVLIDIRSEWCGPCIELSEKTFTDPAVIEAVKRGFVPLELDVTEADDADLELQRRYSAETLPAVILLDAEGNERARIDRFVPPAAMLELIERASG